MNARRSPFALLMLLALAATPASKPATGDPVSLGNDLVRFFAPPSPDWTLKATNNPTPNLVYFQAADAKSALQVQLTPDMQIDAGSLIPMSQAIVKALNDKRVKAGTEMVMPPRLEKDRRLDIVVHEKFKMGTVTVDEMHLYKSVGTRTVMAEVSTMLEDPAASAAVFNAAKASVASAKVSRKTPTPRKP